MNENFENVNNLDIFKNYNDCLDENLITITKEYDEKYVKAINSLTALMSNYISNTKSYIAALTKVNSTLKNQIHFSKYLIGEMSQKKEKYSQLCDRIEMINNTSKLFDNHLLVINNILNIFISEVQKEFKEIKELRIGKWNKIKVIKNKRNDTKHNKSSSRNKIKNNFFENQNYYSNDKIYPPHKNENIYNNFIHCSNIQKNNNLLEKQVNYRKMHFNQSQENYYPNKNKNMINKKNSSSVVKEKNSRNAINIFQNSFSSRNNNSTFIKQTENSKNKNSKTNNPPTEINSSELKLAYKVLEFIFIINNMQLNRNNNNNSELKNKIESLKNELMNLTNEVINQNKNIQNYKNKNIINNNFIYNNKENFDIKDDCDLLNSNEREDFSTKFNNFYEKIDKLKAKNQDLELFIKIKNKENQKLNKIIQNHQMLQSYQENNNIKINNNSIEKINIKKTNINNNYENNNKNDSKVDIALLLNKKIEELNKSIGLIKEEKNQLKNDLISKNKNIKELKERITILLNKNKLLIIDQKNQIHLFFKSKNVNNEEEDIKFEEYKNKYLKLEKDKNELEKELEKEKKKNEKIDTSEIIKLCNKISEYKNKLAYFKDTYKKQKAEIIMNDNNNIINEKELSKDSSEIDMKENDFDIINETSKEDIFDSESNNNVKKNIIDMKHNNNNDLIKQNKILKQKIVQLQNKVKSNNSNNGIDYEKLINNFTKDIKDKDAQITTLNNQIEKLKTQIENKNDNYINNINEKNKNMMDEYESKLLFLKEKNNYFQNNLNSFDDKIKFNEKDIEQLKNNISNSIKIELKITRIEISFISSKENINKNKYSPDKYEILSDKYFNNFHWFLLINKKDKNSLINDFKKMFWAEKSQLINIEKFNKYTSETEEANKNIIKYISKLEEKDDMISKLSYKLNQIEKLNSMEDINLNPSKTEKFDTIITKENFNILLLKIRKLQDELKILKDENIFLKASNNIENKEKENNNVNDSGIILEEDEYNKFEEKLKRGEIQMSENMQKIINKHFNQKKEEAKDDSMDNNYIKSSEKEEEINKITEKNEEENESEEEESESSQNSEKDYKINEANKNNTAVLLRKQLDRITKLYEELEKRLKKIKNAVIKIFRNSILKEKEKEIIKLFEICGFTEEEINEMLLYREQ